MTDFQSSFDLNISGVLVDILIGSHNISSTDIGTYRCHVTGTCGEFYTDPSTLNVKSLPGPALTITGESLVCQGTSGKVYEVPIIANATEYDWTVPYGANIVSGTNERLIEIVYATDAVGGNIRVQGRNSCGTGTVSANHSVTVYPIPLADAGIDLLTVPIEAARCSKASGNGGPRKS